MILLPKNQNFDYSHSGKFISNGEWKHPKNNNSTYEIILVLSGNVYIAEEEKKYCLPPNSILLLEPYKTHYGFKSSTDTSFYWFHFHTNISPDFKFITLSDTYEVKLLLKKLVHCSNSTFYSHNFLDALAFSVLEEIIVSYKSETHKELSVINEISDYIFINSARNLTVAAIAERFNYNSEYISRFFKKHTGISLKAKIIECRLTHAKNLLTNTNYSVKHISEIMNFESDNTFIKFFVYHEKITPSDFRNLYTKTHIVS